MSRTDASSRELARFLAEELRPALPNDVEIEADGSDVVVRVGGAESRNSTGSIVDEDDGRPFVERVVTATDAIMSHVQDVAAEKAGLPWPSGSQDMPLPHVEVVDGRLRAWFGPRPAPVLTLDPLEVARLRQR